MTDDCFTDLDVDWYSEFVASLRDPNRRPDYPPSACFDEGERRNMLRRHAESPIENTLVTSLMDSWKFVPVAHEDVGYRLPRYEISIVMQLPVVGYRIDIGLFFHTLEGVPFKVAIECDGKQFHEGPANERRDAIRDDKLRRAGFEVWRYPGWLLHHHAYVAANEIQDAINDLIQGREPTLTFTRQRANKSPTLDELTRAFWAFYDGVPWPPRMGRNPRERGWRSIDAMLEWAAWSGPDEFPELSRGTAA